MSSGTNLSKSINSHDFCSLLVLDLLDLIHLLFSFNLGFLLFAKRQRQPVARRLEMITVLSPVTNIMFMPGFRRTTLPSLVTGCREEPSNVIRM